MKSVALIRSDAKKHTRYLLNCYERDLPEWMSENGDLVRLQLEVSTRDVCLLEENANECRVQVDFWQHFKDSTFDEDFLQALFAFAKFPPNKDAAKPLLQHGLENGGAWLVYNFREMLRNGHSVEDTLRHHGKAIGNQCSAGNTWIIPMISASIKKRPLRSTHDWLTKAWLPLALWKEGELNAKVSRVAKAHQILNQLGAGMVPLPLNRKDRHQQIVKAIGTVKSNIKRGKR